MGGQADEAESYLVNSEVDFFALSEKYIQEDKPQQINIVNPSEYQKTLSVVAAIGSPAVRKSMVQQWPGERYFTIRASMSYIDKSAKIGDGSIIAPYAVITTNVEIGQHCIVNITASISHNSTLGNYVTVSPGARIAGNVKLGDGVFVGIGAVISNGLKIASGSVIGAGAVVVKDVLEENSVLVGIPAKVIKHSDGWLYEV